MDWLTKRVGQLFEAPTARASAAASSSPPHLPSATAALSSDRPSDAPISAAAAAFDAAATALTREPSSHPVFSRTFLRYAALKQLEATRDGPRPPQARASAVAGQMLVSGHSLRTMLATGASFCSRLLVDSGASVLDWLELTSNQELQNIQVDSNSSTSTSSSGDESPSLILAQYMRMLPRWLCVPDHVEAVNRNGIAASLIHAAQALLQQLQVADTATTPVGAASASHVTARVPSWLSASAAHAPYLARTAGDPAAAQNMSSTCRALLVILAILHALAQYPSTLQTLVQCGSLLDLFDMLPGPEVQSKVAMSAINATDQLQLLVKFDFAACALRALLTSDRCHQVSSAAAAASPSAFPERSYLVADAVQRHSLLTRLMCGCGPSSLDWLGAPFAANVAAIACGILRTTSEVTAALPPPPALAGHSVALDVSASATVLLQFQTCGGYDRMLASLAWTHSECSRLEDPYLRAAPERVRDTELAFSDQLAAVVALACIGTPIMETACLSLLQAHDRAHASSSDEAIVLPRSRGRSRTHSVISATVARDPMCIRNIDALAVIERLLTNLSVKSFESAVRTHPNEHCMLSVSNALLSLSSQHAYNMHLLQALGTMAACVRILPSCSPDVQRSILKLLEFELDNVSDAYDTELDMLCRLLLPRPSGGNGSAAAAAVWIDSSLHGLILALLQRLLRRGDQTFSQSLARGPLVDALLLACTAWSESLVGSEVESRTLAPDVCVASMQLLCHALAAGREHQQQFFALGGRRTLGRLFSILLRAPAALPDSPVEILNAWRHLDDAESMAALVRLVHATMGEMNSDVLLCALGILVMKASAVAFAPEEWIRIGVFELVVGLLTLPSGRLEPSLKNEGGPGAVIEASAAPDLGLLQKCVDILIALIKDRPLNRAYLWTSIGWRALANAIADSGVFSRPPSALAAFQLLFALATENQPSRILVNPCAVLAVIHCLSRTYFGDAASDWHIHDRTVLDMTSLVSSAGGSLLNRQSVADVGAFYQFLHLLCAPLGWLKDEPRHALRDTAIAFLSEAASVSIGTADAASLLDLVRNESESAFVQIALGMTARAQQLLPTTAWQCDRLEAFQSATGPFFEFDPSRSAAGDTACIRIPFIGPAGKCTWPVGAASFSAWICVRSFTSEIPLCEFSTSDARGLLGALIGPDGMLQCFSESRTAPAVFAFRFLPRQWYHVALVHDKGRLFSDSTISLFVDGMHTQSLKLSYPKIDPMVRGDDCAGFVGGHLGFAARSSHEALSQLPANAGIWWLGSIWLFARALTAAEICGMARFGPHHNGLFPKGLVRSAGGSVVSATDSGGTISDADAAVASAAESSIEVFIPSFDASEVLFFFHAGAAESVACFEPLLPISLLARATRQRLSELDSPHYSTRSRSLALPAHAPRLAAANSQRGRSVSVASASAAFDVVDSTAAKPPAALSSSTLAMISIANSAAASASIATLVPNAAALAPMQWRHFSLFSWAMPSDLFALDDENSLSKTPRLNPHVAAFRALVDGATASTHAGRPLGVCLGGCSSIRPSQFADVVRSVGGMGRLLFVARRASNAFQFQQCLALMCAALHANPTNLQEMTRIRGYEQLSVVLKQRPEWITHALVDIVLAICEGRSTMPNQHDASDEVDHVTFEVEHCGTAATDTALASASWSDGSHSYASQAFIEKKSRQAVISNPAACTHLLLDFQIWSAAPEALRLAVFDRLAYWCATGPACANVMNLIQAGSDKPFFQPAETLRTAMAGLEFAQLLAQHEKTHRVLQGSSGMSASSPSASGDAPPRSLVEAEWSCMHLEIERGIEKNAARHLRYPSGFVPPVLSHHSPFVHVFGSLVAVAAAAAAAAVSPSAALPSCKHQSSAVVDDATAPMPAVTVAPPAISISAWSEVVHVDECFNTRRLKQAGAWHCILLELGRMRADGRAVSASDMAGWRALLQGLVLDGISTPDLVSAILFVSNRDNITTSDAVTGICAELLETFALAVAHASARPPESHLHRIMRQLELLNLKFIFNLFHPKLPLRIVHAALYLFCTLLNYSALFARRVVHNQSLDTLGEHLAAIKVTAPMLGMLFATLCGAPVDTLTNVEFSALAMQAALRRNLDTLRPPPSSLALASAAAAPAFVDSLRPHSFPPIARVLLACMMGALERLHERAHADLSPERQTREAAMLNESLIFLHMLFARSPRLSDYLRCHCAAGGNQYPIFVALTRIVCVATAVSQRADGAEDASASATALASTAKLGHQMLRVLFLKTIAASADLPLDAASMQANKDADFSVLIAQCNEVFAAATACARPSYFDQIFGDLVTQAQETAASDRKQWAFLRASSVIKEVVLGASASLAAAARSASASVDSSGHALSFRDHLVEFRAQSMHVSRYFEKRRLRQSKREAASASSAWEALVGLHGGIRGSGGDSMHGAVLRLGCLSAEAAATASDAELWFAIERCLGRRSVLNTIETPARVRSRMHVADQTRAFFAAYGLGPRDVISQIQRCLGARNDNDNDEARTAFVDQPVSRAAAAPSTAAAAAAASDEMPLRELMAAGDSVIFAAPCFRIDGLSSLGGVLVGGRHHLYIFDGVTCVDGASVPVSAATAAAAVTSALVFCASRVRRVDSSSSDGERISIRIERSSASISSASVSAAERDSECENVAFPFVLCVDKTKFDRAPLAAAVPTHRWAYGSIREMHKRRYQLSAVAIEFFLVSGATFLVVFASPRERDSAYAEIESQGLSVQAQDASVSSAQADALHEVAKGGDSAESLQLRLTATSNPFTAIGASLRGSMTFSDARAAIFRTSATQRWVDGELSNFDYLMHCNSLAGRSFNDLTQYPVFPWVLQDYASPELDLADPRVYRDLSKPMGAIGAQRAAEFRERFDSWDDASIPAFHYGTHYSSSACVLNYLIRMEPYTRMALEFQGGKFDHADRLFTSIERAWSLSSATGGLSDVKELTPEFFTLPDFLVNANRWSLGAKQDGSVVGDVQLPAWAKGSAERFVRMHRAALESAHVSAHLHLWIDLIFGHAQRGAAAVAAQNVFYHLTYQDAVDVDAIADPLQRQSTIDQVNNFGQTPMQLFTQRHPPRRVLPHEARPSLSSHPELVVATLVRTLDAPAPVASIWYTGGGSFSAPSGAHPPSAGGGGAESLLTGAAVAAAASAASAASASLAGAASSSSSPSSTVGLAEDRALMATGGHCMLVPPAFDQYTLEFGHADRSLRVVLSKPNATFHVGARAGDAIAIHQNVLASGDASCARAHVSASRALRPHAPSAHVSCVLASDDGRWVFVGGSDASLRAFRLDLPEHRLRSLEVATKRLAAQSAVRASQSRLAERGFVQSLVIKHAPSLATLKDKIDAVLAATASLVYATAEATSATVGALSNSSSSSYAKMVAAASASFRAQPLRFVAALGGHERAITALAACTFSRLLLTGDADGRVMVWGLDTLQLEFALPRHGGGAAVTGIAVNAATGDIFTAAGALLCAWTINGRPLAAARVCDGVFVADDIDAVAASAAASAFGHDILCVAIARQPNGVILTGHRDGSIRICSLEMSPTRPGLVLVARHHLRGTSVDGAPSSPVTALHTSHRAPDSFWSGDACGRVLRWTVREYSKHWVPDASCAQCQRCDKAFGTWVRKHHCRCCGRIFCSACTQRRMPLPALGMVAPVRVCDECASAAADAGAGRDV